MADATTSSVFGTNPLSPTTTVGGNGAEPPVWRSDFEKRLFGKATEVYSDPYQPYGQPRIAPLDPMQNQAYNQVQSAQGAWQPAVNSAISHAQSGMAPFSQQALQPFLSPYVSGVVNEMGRLGTRQYQENILPQTLSPFVGAGQFGSTRSMEFANRAARDFGADLAGRQGGALQNAYDSAMKNYGDWSQRQLSGAQQLGALGQIQSKLMLGDSAALETSGAQRRALDQQAHDIAYQNFIEQREYPAQQLEKLRAFVGMPPMAQYGYTNAAAPGTPPASPAGQSLSGVLGAWGGTNALLKNLGLA